MKIKEIDVVAAGIIELNKEKMSISLAVRLSEICTKIDKILNEARKRTQEIDKDKKLIELRKERELLIKDEKDDSHIVKKLKEIADLKNKILEEEVEFNEFLSIKELEEGLKNNEISGEVINNIKFILK